MEAPDAPAKAEPERGDVPFGPPPWQRHNKRRASLFERILTGGFLVGLLLFGYDYILGGSQATGYLWFQTRQGILEFAAWRVDAYVWVLVPLVAFLVVALRGIMPVIEIPVMNGEHGEAEWVKRWYRPGSLKDRDDLWTWREGKYVAHIHRRYMARRGLMGWGVTVPVERYINEAELEVVYDTRDVTTYLSRTLNRRLQRETQERVVQDHRALRELWQ